jgi:hypothetical protein
MKQELEVSLGGALIIFGNASFDKVNKISELDLP